MRSFSSMVCAPVFYFFLFAFGVTSVFLQPARAEHPVADTEAHEKFIALQIAAMQNETAPQKKLPPPMKPAWKKRVRIPITAYSSEVGQTDSTPFITASGSHVRDGVVAANFLPIGTRVRIPQLYGDKEFVVEDRMNARFHKKMDIWMEDTADARRFGLKNALVEVY